MRSQLSLWSGLRTYSMKRLNLNIDSTRVLKKKNPVSAGSFKETLNIDIGNSILALLEHLSQEVLLNE